MLLALMTALAVTVLVFLNLSGAINLFGRRDTSQPLLDRPEWLTSSLVPVAAGFPASLDWQALARFGQSLPSTPGWQIRYNAVATLARRGSPKLPLDVLIEML